MTLDPTFHTPEVAGWNNIGQPPVFKQSEPMACGHPAGYGMHFTDVSGKKVETNCMKCLVEKVAKLEAQVPAAPAQAPSGRLEFSEYRQAQSANHEDVKGWVLMGIVYLDKLCDVSEEVEPGCAQNNWCAKYRNKKVVLREAQYLFGKPVDTSGVTLSRILELENNLAGAEQSKEFADQVVRAYGKEIEKLKTELAETNRQHATALNTESLLRQNTEKNLRESRAKILELAVKLAEIEAQDNQEPMRLKLPGVLPISEDDPDYKAPM